MMKNLMESWRRYLLVELKYEEVLPKLDSQKFLNSCNYHKVDAQQTKEAILSTVPNDIEDSEKANYLNWRIKQFMMNGVVEGPKQKFVEEFYMIKANNLDRMLTKNDINAFESVQEFTDMMKKSSVRWKSYQTKKKNATVREEDVRKIYEDNEWTVYIPESKAASCQLGTGTRWCTASRGSRNYYTQYHKRDNPLIIFISKQDPNEKYQFSYGSNQYMDKEDKTVYGKGIFFILNDIIKQIKELPKQVINKAKQYKSEKLPNGGMVTQVIGYSGPHITYYNSSGEKHRDDGPAVIIKTPTDGLMIKQEWYKNGKLHRLDGPAIDLVPEQQEWYKDGERHRVGGPAFVYNDPKYPSLSKQEWWQNGVLHREDGPARITNNSEYWYRNGKLDRDDGPAVIQSNGGTTEWFKDGERHRENGPAIIWKNGSESWYKHGKLHRIGGPAISAVDGSEEWFKDGKKHRLDGPAVFNQYTKEYYIDGKRYRSQKAWKEAKEKLGLTSEPESKPEIKPQAEKQPEPDYTTFKFDF